MRVYIAGHNGLVGSALVRSFRNETNIELVTKDKNELDLCDIDRVEEFFFNCKPDFVILAAAHVGGIMANREAPVDFLLKNLQIQNNVISTAHKSDVNNLIFLGSSCIYPGNILRPIRESDLLTGELEETNESYAIAKIAGIKLCSSYKLQYNRDYRCIMPTNLYGPNDNFSGYRSHVIPALLRKFYDAKNSNAKTITIWGSENLDENFYT